MNPPHFSFSLHFRKTFRTSNSTRYQAYIVARLAQAWLSTEARYYSHSMACFFELSMLYEATRLDLVSPETEPSVPRDSAIGLVATVCEWALRGHVAEGGHCANVNIAHAYKWYYGSKDPGNPRDIRLALKHYNSALRDKRIHFTGDILHSLSRARS